MDGRVVLQGVGGESTRERRCPLPVPGGAVRVVGEFVLGHCADDAQFIFIEVVSSQWLGDHICRGDIVRGKRVHNAEDVYYNAGPLIQLWKMWTNVPARDAALQLLCDGAHFSVRDKHKRHAKHADYLPGWLIARRIMHPCAYAGAGKIFVRSLQASQAVWVEHCEFHAECE